MIMKNFSSGEGYGLWDQAGRNIFWMFPNVTFIQATDENYHNVEGTPKFTDGFISDEDLREAQNEGTDTIHISAQGKSADKVSKELIHNMLGLTLRYARLRPAQPEKCLIACLGVEIIIGVDASPENYLMNYLDYLATDNRLTIYTPIRPSHTLPD